MRLMRRRAASVEWFAEEGRRTHGDTLETVGRWAGLGWCVCMGHGVFACEQGVRGAHAWDAAGWLCRAHPVLGWASWMMGCGPGR